MKIRVVKDEKPRHDLKLVTNKQIPNAYAFDIDDNNKFVQNNGLYNVADTFYNDCIYYFTNRDGNLDKLLEVIKNEKDSLNLIGNYIFGFNPYNRFRAMVDAFQNVSRDELSKYVYMIIYDFINDVNNKYHICIPVQILEKSIKLFVSNANVGFKMIIPMYEIALIENEETGKFAASEFSSDSFAMIQNLCSNLYYDIYNYLLFNTDNNSFSAIAHIMNNQINPCIMNVGDAISNVMYNILCRLSQYDFTKAIEILNRV